MNESEPKVYSMHFKTIYTALLAKVERKGVSEEKLLICIEWLTGYARPQITALRESDITYRQFFDRAPHLNPLRKHITGKICGVHIEDIRDDTMREIRYLDKIVDEIARGKEIGKILK